MGSAKMSNAKPQLPTMENKTSKTLSIIKSFFHKDKKKEKAKKKTEEKQNNHTIQSKNDETVATILKTFENLNINNKKPETTESITEAKEDELANFTFKVIEEDSRSCRIDSQSSTDSGIADIKDEVADTLEKLTIDDKDSEKGKKKLHQVVVKRAPIRTNKVSEYSAHPYANRTEEYKQISQINKQILSGGQLIVNSSAVDISTELDLALESVAQLHQTQQTSEYLTDLFDIISKDEKQRDDVLADFENELKHNLVEFSHVPEVTLPEVPNPIEEFSVIQHLSYEDSDSLELTNSILSGNCYQDVSDSIFLTPPRSETVSSPMSDSQVSFYPANSDYTFSPERSSPVNDNIDLEKYQEISIEEDKTKRDRTSSASAMTMKNFKDLQKEIANGFSKKECCDIERKPCDKLFDEHMQRLKAVERRNLCLKVSKLDLKMAYGVLHHTLVSLSRECDQEDLQFALFALVAHRVLAESPVMFVGDFGLSILKAAALRCPHHPLLTRFIVHCVYLVLRSDTSLQAQCSECVFHEVDAQGDNLIIACARGGDRFALVLAEIARSDIKGELPPLFRLHHANADGYTALQVACRQHSASNSHLHTVHVLLEHASADLWKGDVKGGETSLHLAVNSAQCDIALVMLLFRHVDRKLWKKLAHAHNMSSVTPLEYARSATRSSTRLNYPHEVLDFLKKCR